MRRNTSSDVGLSNLSAEILRFLSIVVALCVGVVANAANWQFNPHVYVGLNLTDNVELNPKGGEESEAILELSPAFRLRRDGKQVDVDVDYRLQGLLYNGDDQRNEAYSYLQATADASVIPDLFTVNTEASISQVVIDSRASSPYSSISVSGNTSQIAQLFVSPNIRRRIGAYTSFDLGAEAGIIEYDDPRQFDSTNTEFFAHLTNEGGAGILDWQFSFTSQTVDYDIGRKVEFVRSSGEVGLRLGPRTELVLSGGEDANDFGSLPGTRSAEGSFWNAGLRGSIGTSIQYDARVGEQFFGKSYALSFERNARRLVTGISYSEDATTIGAEQLDYNNAFSFIADILGIDLPRADPELYIRKRGNISQSVDFGRSSVTVSAFYEDRTYIRTFLAGQKENLIGGTLVWNWQYNDVLSLSGDTTYLRLDSRDGFDQPEDFKFGITARRSLQQNTSIIVRYWLNTRSATLADREYDENTITIGYRRDF
ncbi:MAG: TIGR03016 family PEP-CTERM system-associated outer membrane protein [Gammaproteobacteria bacterium]|nr:TIGR03016 family PEP-CTERM system-associated outer membrane protein [Gammaproteobacteria bacterium]